MKSISFIIPCYNEEKRLEKTFKALETARIPRGFMLEQIIFVDDGSRDKTFLKLSKLVQEYPKLNASIISYKKRLGIKKAREEGIIHSNASINIVLPPTLSGIEKKLKKFQPNQKKRKKIKPPLVSVIMPVYNQEKYLTSAIESIVNQTYKRFELIIIDDESTDGSTEIIKAYKRRYRSKIKIIKTGKNLNRGGDMCANLGIEEASGKYIARMDADDIAVLTRLENQVEFLEKNPKVLLVGSSAYVINKRGTVIGEKNEPCNPLDIYKSYATFHPIIHPSAMIRRIFDGKKFYYQINYSANNDYYTFFKLVCRGYIFVNLKDKLLFYRIHDKNDTFLDIKKKFLNTIRIRLDMVSNFNYRPSFKDILINIAQTSILLILPENMSKNLYLVTKGIIKPKKLNFSFLQRLILSSSPV